MADCPVEIGGIVTFTTDFGLADSYVGEMKVAVLRACPGARLVDVTHLVPRHDIVAGALQVGRMVQACGAGTVHVAVVDPGVGTARRIVAVEVGRQWVVCPDNGLVTWAWRRAGGGRAYEVTWRGRGTSSTFHGRDVMGPVGGMLARGEAIENVGRLIADPVLLDLDVAAGRVGRVIHVDGFGNVVTNIVEASVGGATSVRVGSRVLPVRRAYGDVGRGEGLGLVGSAGLVEVAVREGSAAEVFGLRVGDEVEVL